VIVAILICAGFLILGVKYAILLGIFSALLKLIPYLGIVTACLLTILITVSTNSPATVTGALIVLLIVHIIDGNFLFPAIVGSKVKMNALATIVGVVIGNALWGIAGMFLAIPLLATLKVIFDSVEPFRPWAILLGDDPRIPKIKRGKIKKL
jgi:predicted PurR-regulated permease PerM